MTRMIAKAKPATIQGTHLLRAWFVPADTATLASPVNVGFFLGTGLEGMGDGATSEYGGGAAIWGAMGSGGVAAF